MTTKSQDNQDMGEGSSWHYFRVCQNCGWTWYGLHCPHDGYQNPCPHCHKKPKTLPDPYMQGCDCEFFPDVKAEIAQSQAHLLANVEGKLPEKASMTVVRGTFANNPVQIGYHKGFNEAIDQVKQILKEQGVK